MRRRLDEFSKQYTLNGKGIDNLSETINQQLKKIEMGNGMGSYLPTMLMKVL